MKQYITLEESISDFKEDFTKLLKENPNRKFNILNYKTTTVLVGYFLLPDGRVSKKTEDASEEMIYESFFSVADFFNGLGKILTEISIQEGTELAIDTINSIFIAESGYPTVIQLRDELKSERRINRDLIRLAQYFKKNRENNGQNL